MNVTRWIYSWKWYLFRSHKKLLFNPLFLLLVSGILDTEITLSFTKINVLENDTRTFSSLVPEWQLWAASLLSCNFSLPQQACLFLLSHYNLLDARREILLVVQILCSALLERRQNYHCQRMINSSTMSLSAPFNQMNQFSLPSFKKKNSLSYVSHSGFYYLLVSSLLWECKIWHVIQSKNCLFLREDTRFFGSGKHKMIFP